MTSILAKHDILKLIREKPSLVEEYMDLEAQVQPNGFDLTVREVALLETPGKIAVSNHHREVSSLAPLSFDAEGFIDLMPGNYMLTFNEIVHIPRYLMALATARSSLLRCGVSVHTAVWDAGYSGRSQSLMVVHHPRGFRLQRNARVIQLVFFKLTGETDGYQGVYQGENIGS